MSRKRTGLRNRFRNGRGPYSIRRKGKNADRYSSFNQGRPQGPDLIAGHSVLAVKREEKTTE